MILLAIVFSFTTYKISFFITRDLEDYSDAMAVSEGEAIQSTTSYQNYLIHKSITSLIEIVAPEGDSAFPTEAEMMFLKHEIAVYEELGENKLTDRPL